VVVQTHHYHRPAYLAVAAVSALAGFASIAAGASSHGAWKLAAPLLGLLLIAFGTLLLLRFANECLYFAPGRLIYIDWRGRRRAELPLEQIRGLARGPALYEIKGTSCRIRFDPSITDCEALVGELDWQIRRRQGS
jgi:hypothetical protein